MAPVEKTLTPLNTWDARERESNSHQETIDIVKITENAFIPFAPSPVPIVDIHVFFMLI